MGEKGGRRAGLHALLFGCWFVINSLLTIVLFLHQGSSLLKKH